jgi:uncharacterized protein (TIGR02145 family)
MIKIGTSTLNQQRITIGTTELQKVYVGSNLVWQKPIVVVSGMGKLYSKLSVLSTKNIAASGWHVPTLAEWNILITYLGGSSVAGGKLKEVGTAHWNSPNTGATNSAGFYGFGSGTEDGFGTFSGIKTYAEFWSASASSTDRYYTAALRYDSGAAFIYTGGFGTTDGGSVRLIKNDATLATYVGNDGKTYTTVKIGNQVWMSQNLKEIKYRDGTDIESYQWEWYNNNSGYE